MKGLIWVRMGGLVGGGRGGGGGGLKLRLKLGLK